MLRRRIAPLLERRPPSPAPRLPAPIGQVAEQPAAPVPEAVQGPVPEAVRQLPGSAQVAECELGACYQQLGLAGTCHAGPGVPAGKQSTIVKQVQPV